MVFISVVAVIAGEDIEFLVNHHLCPMVQLMFLLVVDLLFLLAVSLFFLLVCIM